MVASGSERHERSRGVATVDFQALVSTCYSCLVRITYFCSSPSPRSYLQLASVTLNSSDLHAAHGASRPHGASTHLVATRSMPPLMSCPTRPQARCLHTPTATIPLQTSGQTLSPLVWHLTCLWSDLIATRTIPGHTHCQTSSPPLLGSSGFSMAQP